jgi:hypothetical protein
MRERLNATAGTELERLLVTMISLGWLALQHAQIDVADRLDQSGTSPAAVAAQRRLDRAHAHFLSGTKTLASVAKLVRRVPSPLELLRVQGDAMVPSQAGDRATQRFHAAAAVN